jgi:hypothetical protein
VILPSRFLQKNMRENKYKAGFVVVVVVVDQKLQGRMKAKRKAKVEVKVKVWEAQVATMVVIRIILKSMPVHRMVAMRMVRVVAMTIQKSMPP